ncbi:AAA-domain-containing protein, partial [Hanseniaspora valbyensis NRRL Y-1626]
NMRHSSRRSIFTDDDVNNESLDYSHNDLDDFDNNMPVDTTTNTGNPIDTSQEHFDEAEEDENVKFRLRTRQPVNYKSTKYIDDDEDEEEDQIDFKKERRGRPRVNKTNQEENEEVNNSRTRTLRNFIDDEEEMDEDEQDSLIGDLHDLAEENEAFTSPKRHLRERATRVNYELPHPDSDINVFNKFNKHLEDEEGAERDGSLFNSTEKPRVGRRRNGAKSNSHVFNSDDYPLKRLYQTSGPFGGNNTISLINKFDHNVLKTKIIKADLNQPLLLPPDRSKNKNHNFTPTLKGMESDSSSSSSDEHINADTDPIQIPKETSFDNIGGLDNYITQLKEMIMLPLLYPELYTNFNIQPPRGVLFHGPPGTGKTLMARALAAQSSKDSNTKITFYMRKGSDILSKWVGEAERQLRLLFEQAASTQPSIIFFDELDGLAPVRSSKQEQIHSSIVSTLLALMDGMDSRGQVVVIGATNRPDSLDPALRRGGRFDREFYFGLPGKEARLKILQIHTKGWKNLDQDILEEVADLSNGFGGADLKQLCVEAALGAVMRTYPQIYSTSKDVAKLKTGGKYQVDVNKVFVTSGDFNRALEKINPSSTRQGGASSYEKLPIVLEPLLKKQEQDAIAKFDDIFPILEKEKKSSSLIDHYLDNEIKNTSFKEFQFMKNLSNSRFNKPFLFIKGHGSEYISSSLLHRMDNVNIQSLDLSYLHSDLGKSIDSAIVTSFNEAKRRQPSILFIPNAELWSETIIQNLPTFETLLQTIKFEDKILVLFSGEEIPINLKHLFKNVRNIINIKAPVKSQLEEYFEKNLKEFLISPASRFENAKKRINPLPPLPVVETNVNVPSTEENNEETVNKKVDSLLPLRTYLDAYKRSDMKLKNKLKVKLAGLMDLLKIRYKKFKKPLVDDECLLSLFETSPFHTPVYQLENNYVKDTTTNTLFTNMDLDTIEERLWNGFYSEPKQFFKDILLIYDDAIVSKVRERIISASEMVANSDVFIDEMLLPNELYLTQEWKNGKKRDDLREKLKIVDGIDVYSPEEEENEEKDEEEDVIINDEEAEEKEEVNIEEKDQPNFASYTANVDAEKNHHQMENTEETQLASSKPIEKIPETLTTIVEPLEPQVVEEENVTIDMNKLNNCISQLITLAETMSIDDLQHLVSDIINFLWPFRVDNDKQIALTKLQEYIDNI